MIAVYNVYNSAATIRESLESILPYVKRVIAVDGAYKKFPHKLRSGASHDGTKQIFHELCGPKLTWVDQRKPMSQVAKKNKVLKHIPDGVWFFRIAGDEIVTGNIREALKFAEASKYSNIGVPLRNYLPIWKGYEIRKKGGHAYIDLSKPISQRAWRRLKWKAYDGYANRIVRKQKRMRFKRHHSTLYRGNKLLRMQVKIDNMQIINQPQKTGWKRWHDKIEYKKRRYLQGDYIG